MAEYRDGEVARFGVACVEITRVKGTWVKSTCVKSSRTPRAQVAPISATARLTDR
jgi:hypothetical protein